MNSLLTETVNLDVEDFSESFLTCSTCLCVYDGGEHSPKLLTCSHTVCLHCLTQIVESTFNRSRNQQHQTQNERDVPSSFSCPICREVIQVPRGGVSVLPPSFLVNQLLDLMTRKRREIIPKCGVHFSQELLFCETCDVVFCSHCSKGSHESNTINYRDSPVLGNTILKEHTVVPLSIAIKRMSEIFLYKTNEISSKLVQAEENVTSELNRLQISESKALEDVEKAYAKLEDCLKKAKNIALQSVSQLANRKSQVLKEQLEVINREKKSVERDLNGIDCQVEVGNLSDRISVLQEKFEAVSELAEPKENSYLVYELVKSHSNNRNHLEQQLEQLVCNVGRPRSSSTSPNSSLCQLSVNDSCGYSKTNDRPFFVTHQGVCGLIEMVDYHGRRRQSGGDPVQVTVESDGLKSVPCSIVDVGDGSYRFWFRARQAQQYRVLVSLFDHPLKNSPLIADVVDHCQPQNTTGSKGSDTNQFIQPSGIAVGRSSTDEDDHVVYAIDSGNQRIAKYSRNLHLIGYLNSPALEGRSATGIGASTRSDGSPSLWIANWKTRSVMEVSTEDGRIYRSVTLPFLKEPIDIAVNSQGHVLIADAGLSSVVVAELSSSSKDSKVLCKCGSAGSGKGQFPENTLRAITCAINDDIVAADSKAIQIFSNKGAYIRTLSTTITKGSFGGLAYDGFDHLLASYTEGAKNKTSRCGIWMIRYSTGQVLFNFDSNEARLRRPGRLSFSHISQEASDESITSERDSKAEGGLEPHKAGFIYVVDAGDDSIKQYRYL